MNSRKKIWATFGVSILAINACQAAYAQHGEGPDASTEVSQARGLGEIIVTARRREEQLQDVPVAVTALDSTLLAQNQVDSAKDLDRLVPSLHVNSNSSREGGRYTLRGQGTTIGAGEGVVVYFAETPTPQFGSGGVGMYFDLDSVQVLNGPQGTLFGRNTTGGAVLFTPKKPDNKLGGFVEAGYGNYDNREASGAVNFPIIEDALMIRMAGTIRQRDGFTHNLSDGKDYDDLDYWGARLSIVARPADWIENYTILTRVKSHPNGSSWVLTHVNPNGVALRLFPGLADAFAAQQARGPRVIDTNATPKWYSDTKALINTTTLDVSDDVTIKNIFSYFDAKTALGYDLDGTKIDVISFDGKVPLRGNVSASALSAAKYTTNELQLSGKSFGGDLNWVTGLYYQTYHTSEPRNTGSSVLGGVTQSFPHERGNSKAVFAQATLGLGLLADGLSDFNFTAGYRYTWDERRTTVNAWRPSTGACTTGIVGIGPDCARTYSGDFSAGTYTFTLDYHLSPAIMVYANWRRGYKSGGFNTTTPPDAIHASFGPEYVTDYELGLKTDFDLGFPVRLNVTAFNDDYSDIQRNQNIIDERTTPPSVLGLVLNAAKARIRGVEVESTLKPTPELTFTGFYSYLDAAYREYSFSGTDLSGVRLPFTPKHKVGVSARYELPVPDALGQPYIFASYNYNSAFRWNDLDLPGNVVNGYGLFDLTVGWENIGGSGLTGTAFMSNVGNKLYRQISSVQYASVGISSAIYGEPRMYGLRLKYAFD